MSLTQDKKAAHKALTTLQTVEKQLSGEMRNNYKRALEIVARYNVSLRQARPVEITLEAPQSETHVEQNLKAEIHDLKNQLEQAKRQIERERNRPIDFGSTESFMEFCNWCENAELKDTASYAQTSVNCSAKQILALVGGNTEEPTIDVIKRACCKTVSLINEIAKEVDPSVADLVDLVQADFERASPLRLRGQSLTEEQLKALADS